MSNRKETPDILGAVMTGVSASPVELSKTETIRAHDLIVTGGTQIRGNLDRSVVADYADALLAGLVLPPVEVVYDGSVHYLWDGFHRKAAYEQVYGAVTLVECVITPGTKRDAVLLAAGANASHGLRRSDATKRRAAELLLKDDEWGKWSDREIARRCGVSHVFVAKCRARLVKAGEVEEATERTYTHRHGGTSTMRPAEKPQIITGNVSSDEATGRHTPNGATIDRQRAPQTPATPRNGATSATTHAGTGTPQAPTPTPASRGEAGATVAVDLSLEVAGWLRDAVRRSFLATPNRMAVLAALEQALAGYRPTTRPEPRPTVDWRDGWNEADQAEYDALGEYYQIGQIERPRVSLRKIEEEDADMRPALWRRYHTLKEVDA